MKTSLLKKFCLAALMLGALVGTASAQDPVYHLVLEYESQPTGPNETFYVRLILTEHTIDVGAYQLLVGYDQAQGSLVALHNNLGPAGTNAGAILDLLAIKPLSGVPYADTSRQITLETAGAILPPADASEDFNLGRLEFQTSSTYSSAQGQFGVYLTANGSKLGFYDGNVDPILVECASLNPAAAVADWAMY